MPSIATRIVSKLVPGTGPGHSLHSRRSFSNFFSNILQNKKFVFLISDLLLISFSYYFAFLVRFDMNIPLNYLSTMIYTLPLIVLVRFALFKYNRLYNMSYYFASIHDLFSIIKAITMSSIFILLILYLINRFEGYPRSVFFIDWLLLIILIGGSRFAIRITKELQHFKDRSGKRVLIVGGGESGESIIRETLRNKTVNFNPIGIIDDKPSKKGCKIHGITVMGNTTELPVLIKKFRIEEIIIAIPSADGAAMRRIVGICRGCDVPYKTLPGIGELIDGRVSVKALRDVNYTDLLRRPPVKLDVSGIKGYLSDRCILVTGGGGSIGSELCRQLVRFKPRNLVIVDVSEENLHRIQMEFQHELKFTNFHIALAKVQVHSSMETIFRDHRPDVVFHAAAYKHVPLVELNPWEAIFSNVKGSRTIMELAIKYGVDRFVLVSTDKAVRPANVMGASKRVAELLLQSFQGSKTRLMAVRFGNVVGSSGSAVPLFRRQIELGGPITLTHSEATRYFMSIPEAAQLILQAGAIGKGGEIFVLEMGTPVRIVDLANDLIRLSGKEPEKDIQIVFTGLRPGEKLYEEIITNDESIMHTEHEKILVLRPNGGRPASDLRNWLDRKLDGLYEAAMQMNAPLIKKKLREIVPEYTPMTENLEPVPPAVATRTPDAYLLDKPISVQRNRTKLLTNHRKVSHNI
jgi:FlaA1/EpsC-like NDP-sugar epimerase